MIQLNIPFSLLLTASLLASCGGGDSPAETPTDPMVTAPTPTPSPTPTACTAAPVSNTGYSLVFKGCNTSNVAEYFDKTECVRDNATGLIWEGKSPSGNRAYTNVYTNFDSTSDPQKLSNGSYINPNLADINASNNTIGYQNSVNSANLCGLSNWRMPLRLELQSIQAANGKVDTNWFPNTVASFYWSTSLTPALPRNQAIVVNFNSGGYGDFGRESMQSVRLVRH